MPAPDKPTWTCRRGERCDAATPLLDPDTHRRIGWAPAAPTGNAPDGLCTTCTGRLGAALASAPRQLVELTALLGKDQAAAPPDPTPGQLNKHPPIPLRVTVEAVRAWLDHELTTWARHLALQHDAHLFNDDGDQHHPGPLEWHPTRFRGRLGARTVAAAAYLRLHQRRLLTLDPVDHPLRSMGDLPEHGHDPDTTTVGAIDRGRSGLAPTAWQRQDGVDAAITLLDLHRRAEHVAGHSAAVETSAVPCPRCSWPTRTRRAGEDLWRCGGCPATYSEHDHDVLRDALLRSHPARRGAPAQ